MSKAWLIRPLIPGDKINYTDDFVLNKYIATGPNNLPRLQNYTLDKIKKLILDNRIVGDKLSAGMLAAILDNFANNMQVMDLGLLVNGDIIYVLEITGEYDYSHNNYSKLNYLRHRRSVRFLNSYRRDELSSALRAGLRPGRQVADISKYYNEIYKLAYGKEPVETAAAPVDRISVSYPLRPGYNISFSVPSDITDTEARRLSDYIKTLFFKEIK